MWHLIEDFFEKNLVLMALTGLGWLAVAIMGTSMIYTIYSMATAA